MQWKPDRFIKYRAASSAKLPCTLRRWSIYFKGRQAVTADRLCFYREDTFKRNKTLAEPGGIISWCGIGKSAVDVSSFPLPPAIQFQVLQNCCFSFQGHEKLLFSHFLCWSPRVGFAFQDGAEGNSRASGCTAWLQKLSAGRMAAAVHTSLSDSSGFRIVPTPLIHRDP